MLIVAAFVALSSIFGLSDVGLGLNPIIGAAFVVITLLVGFVLLYWHKLPLWMLMPMALLALLAVPSFLFTTAYIMKHPKEVEMERANEAAMNEALERAKFTEDDAVHLISSVPEVAAWLKTHGVTDPSGTSRFEVGTSFSTQGNVTNATYEVALADDDSHAYRFRVHSETGIVTLIPSFDDNLSYVPDPFIHAPLTPLGIELKPIVTAGDTPQ